MTFAEGSMLRGAPAQTPPETLEGIGVRADNAPGLRLSGLRVQGFKVGLHISACDGLVLEDLDAQNNFQELLGSDPTAEDANDWLYPHHNDGAEWRKHYGAAVYIEQSRHVAVRRIRVRHGQNGIVLDRVEASSVYDNDCSFLSGWGLALWRSSRNTIAHNAFDFCIRGYSHGVYNRGQDSAGILMFEQCNENLLVANSCTHGGDGFFGFAGREALGEAPPPQADFDYAKRGNRSNTFYHNDFSYAAAHGLEQTFSSDNVIWDNRLVGNAICGLWGGYSNNMTIVGNHFERNGDAGYGLERGAINLEHGANTQILLNQFLRNRCSIHLWTDPDEVVMRLPWAAANHRGSRDVAILSNRMEGEEVVLHLRGSEAITFANNEIHDEGELLRGAALDSLTIDSDRTASSPNLSLEVPGEARPVGARDALAGRETIVMGSYGPWDHASVFGRFAGRREDKHVYQVWTMGKPLDAHLNGSGYSLAQHKSESKGEPTELWIAPLENAAGVYSLRLACDDWQQTFVRELLEIRWQTRFFEWSIDPREDMDAWLREATNAPPALLLNSLDFPFGMGGPRNLQLSEQLSTQGPGPDHFGVLAESELYLAPMEWELQTQSDDGIRVWVGGELVIDNWTHHGTTSDSGRFVVTAGTKTHLLVAYFEIDGAARLKVTLQPRRSPQKQ